MRKIIACSFKDTKIKLVISSWAGSTPAPVTNLLDEAENANAQTGMQWIQLPKAAIWTHFAEDLPLHRRISSISQDTDETETRWRSPRGLGFFEKASSPLRLWIILVSISTSAIDASKDMFMEKALHLANMVTTLGQEFDSSYLKPAGGNTSSKLPAALDLKGTRLSLIDRDEDCVCLLRRWRLLQAERASASQDMSSFRYF